MTQLAVAGIIPEWTLGDRLRKARESAGLNQTELSELAEISRRSISKYEAGEAVPRRPHLLAWAMATGVATAWLEQGDTVRPKGLEPLTFWTVLWEHVKRVANRDTRHADDYALTA